MIVKNVEKKEKNAVTFQVEIEKDAFEAALNQAYLKNKKQIALPGFRKGKAPRKVIEGFYGPEVFYDEAVDALAPVAFGFGVKEAELKVVGRPSVTDMNVAEDKTLTLSFASALYPEVKLGQYKELTAVKPAYTVSDADVDGELQSLRERNARVVTVERAAANGDVAVIDFEGFLEGVPFEGGKGEDHELTLGSGQFVPGFEEQVVGMTAGEEKDLDITFPENYHADLAGKAVVFKVKLKEVKERQLPELDDEFAKDVSECDTLEAYKAQIVEKLTSSREAMADNEFKNNLLQAAIDNMTVEIPEEMVEEKVDTMINEYAQNLRMQGYSLEQYLGMMGMEMNVFRDSAKPGALEQVKKDVLFAAIAEEEKFEITDEEVEAEYKSLTEMYKVDMEAAKAAVDPELIKEDLRVKKASELIYSTGIATAAEEKPAKPKAKRTTKKKVETEEAPAEEAPAEEKPKAKRTTKKKAETETEAKVEE